MHRLTSRDSDSAFLLQYLLHPRSVGAVKPSSPQLAEKMLANVRFDRAKCIAELGAGTGVFTDEIVKRLRGDTQLLVFEVNSAFCRKLERRYAHLPQVHIIHDSAEHLGDYLRQCGFRRADYIVSGLPFASLPADVSHRILSACAENLKPCGRFVTFQYTLLKRRLIARYFPQIRIRRERRNLPPAYIFLCKPSRALYLHSEANL